MPNNSEYDAKVRFLRWLESRVITAGRGDDVENSENDPWGRFWLGRLAPEDDVATTGLNERGERLEPCAVGLRLRPTGNGPWIFDAKISASCWLSNAKSWRKVHLVEEWIRVEAGPLATVGSFGRETLEGAFERKVGMKGFSAEIRIEIGPGIGGSRELAIMLVNTSSGGSGLSDTRLYECRLEVVGIDTEPFILEALPDSFRYDRNVVAYGINCGVEVTAEGYATTDAIGVDRPRPIFWSSNDPEPDLTFATLEQDPLGAIRSLRDALSCWGAVAWSQESLRERASSSGWSLEMVEEAQGEASLFSEELDRVSIGVQLLESDAGLLRCFRLMNRAMAISARGRGYDRWRPFQIGFILANLSCIVKPETEADIVDIVWFATGGGKTETYLGLLVTAALHDRMRGKSVGITAWTRFPLRLLSLQQLQRFADALAAAEIVRREDGIGGDPLSLGFFVGQAATPNSIKPDPTTEHEPDPDDEEMPERYRVLQRCPFCRSEALEMAFERSLWTLEHRCGAPGCPWPERALPFYVVDDEIYRFLPTVVVGTLDKAASIAIQASMRGFVGAPLGRCLRPGHGFTYATRSNRPHGCLVPGCNSRSGNLPMTERLFGPSFRLQDELHLLRDSLGAVDAHYEALLDGLELELCGARPKILASSATLEGYEEQVEVLYRRKGRVFPQQGPSVAEGFWTSGSDQLMRRFVAIAPRGLTIEYALDRMLTELQRAIRDLAQRPAEVCREVGIDPEHASKLLSLYGTNVIFGNTLRDLDAVERSIQSGQIQVEGPLRATPLTGRTGFEDVREALRRLEEPEAEFLDRIHVITASSMMSHGVDVDRLNVMVMIGLPLGTAEFIQATARVGRRHPGLVFVVHKIGRERDAGIFRSFAKFVEQGDRFVETIPITRRSRRVLKRTVAGLELARVLLIHEPRSGGSLVSLKKLRDYAVAGRIDFDRECSTIAGYLGIDSETDPDLLSDLQEWFENFRRKVLYPQPDHKFSSEAAGKPIMSLRDVEDQVPLFLNREP